MIFSLVFLFMDTQIHADTHMYGYADSILVVKEKGRVREREKGLHLLRLSHLFYNPQLLRHSLSDSVVIFLLRTS